MPVDRGIAEDLARTLGDLYADAANRIAADIARRIGDVNSTPPPEWAPRKLARLRDLEVAVARILNGLSGRAGREIEQALVLAYVRGGREALDELARLGMTRAERLALGNQVDALRRLGDLAARRRVALQAMIDAVRVDLPGIDALQRLAFSLVSKTQGTHLRILRWSLDVYREVIARTAAPGVILGTTTRVRAAQVAWEELLGRGVTGFVDRAGRRWELASYVEMATRSTTAQAAVQSHLDRLGQAGLDLVIVSNAPQECKLCRPWEAKVLDRRRGGARVERIEHATVDGRLLDVEIAGSVDEAIRAGLLHPNCRHSLSAYLPGVTTVQTHTEDPDGDAARQEQRALERDIRAEKRKLAGVGPLGIDGTAIRAKIRTLQAELRAHVDDNPGLFRKPGREQLGVAR